MTTFWYIVGVLWKKGPVTKWASKRDTRFQEISIVADRLIGVNHDQRVEDLIDLTVFRPYVLRDLENIEIGDLVEANGTVQSQPFTSKTTGKPGIFIRLYVQEIRIMAHRFRQAPATLPDGTEPKEEA